ncbi:Extracellular matrix protein fras1 [Cichlidogyrus casuarinus]|uniref:Extracellular matrix protein fras1 n=1 Tax=Cichlidogyrus casuarinus TaxID=1844966 RepID=A0ABD2QBM6_9PLAT
MSAACFRQCVSQCPNGTTAAFGVNSSGGRLCEHCWSLCENCFKADLEFGCVSCSEGLILVPFVFASSLIGSESGPASKMPRFIGSCKMNCPAGHFPDESLGVCLQCAPNCSECNGPLESDCLACRKGYLLSNGRCQDASQVSCPAGEFFYRGHCTNCPVSNCEQNYCAILNNGEDEAKCLWCEASHPYMHQGNCLSHCPDGYFPARALQSASEFGLEASDSRFLCEACPPGCIDCSPLITEALALSTEPKSEAELVSRTPPIARSVCKTCKPGLDLSADKQSCAYQCPAGYLSLSN